MNILELQKEKILVRKKDPTRSSVLGTIIDGAKKIAKEETREVSEDDLLLSAKRNYKALNKVVNDVMKEMGIRKNDPMLKHYIDEIKVTEEFLPKVLGENETSFLIMQVINNLPEDQRNIGKVMGILKKNHSEKINMGLASKLVKESL